MSDDDAIDSDFAVERTWYDDEETSRVVDSSVKRFPKFKSHDGLGLTPSANLQKQMDLDKWEQKIIAQSGILPTQPAANYDDEESECRVYLSVNSARPEFLSAFGC